MSNKQKIKLFFDCEFTGLVQDTTLISIGFITNDRKTFYAEFIDYDRTKVDDWVQEKVIDNLVFNNHSPFYTLTPDKCEAKGDTKYISKLLKEWLDLITNNGEFQIEIWSDCLAYDWVLFCNLFGGAFGIPKYIYYIPFDLCTLLLINGVDPDRSRVEYSVDYISKEIEIVQHNSLHDAITIKGCYDKIVHCNQEAYNMTKYVSEKTINNVKLINQPASFLSDIKMI